MLAYDFGGGTFDVSILRLENQVYKVVATGGDNHLGGADLDDLIVKHLISVVKTKHDKVVSNNRALHRLRQASEQAKRDLSVNQKTEIDLPGV